MKHWGFLVAVLYGLVLVVLTGPVAVATFWPEVDLEELLTDGPYLAWPYWVWIGLMMLCQACLLLIPVRIANRRPVSKRAVYIPIVVSGFFAACLVFGTIASLLECIQADLPFQEEWHGWAALAVSVLWWGIWSFGFSRMARDYNPKDLVASLCRCLLRDSILELLVAVPTHIVARQRNYCCAGLYTFMGIVFGLSVMLLSFGPGVYFLFAERWKRLHPTAETDEE